MKKFTLFLITLFMMTATASVLAESTPTAPANNEMTAKKQEFKNEMNGERIKAIDARIQRHRDMISYLEKVKQTCIIEDNKAECKKIKDEMKRMHEDFRQKMANSRKEMKGKREAFKGDAKAHKHKKKKNKENAGAPIEYQPAESMPAEGTPAE